MTKRILSLFVIAALGAMAAYLIQMCRHAPAPQRPAPQGPRESVVGTAPAVASSANSTLSRTPLIRTTGSAEDADKIGSMDPRGSGYDPVVLHRSLDTSPPKIFDQEPRDAAFAGPREVALLERVVERLRARVSFVPTVDVACRTSSCELTIEGGKTSADINDALQAIDLHQISEITTVGPLRHADDTSRNGISIVILYSAALRDHAAYEQLLRRHKEHDVSPKAP